MRIIDMASGPKQAVQTAVHNIRQRLITQMAHTKEPVLMDHFRTQHEAYDFNKISQVELEELHPDMRNNIRLQLKEDSSMAGIAADQLERALYAKPVEA